MSKHVYPAIFTQEADGKFAVEFPDVKGCLTCGDNLVEAMEMASDALGLMVATLIDEGKALPTATPIKQVDAGDGSFASLVLCDTEKVGAEPFEKQTDEE